MKKYALIILLMMVITGLLAQNRIQIDLTLYFANNEVGGDIIIVEYLPDSSGESYVDSYPAGVTQHMVITHTTPWMGCFINPDAIFLDIYCQPTSGLQHHDHQRVYLDFPNTTVYDVYVVFDYENWLTNFDMDHSATVEIFNKRSFKITGQVMATDPGAGGGEPEDYGVRYNVNSVSENLVRDFYVQPIENWNTWYDFTVEFSADYNIGDNIFFYDGNNYINQFGIYPAGYQRMVYVQNVKIEFEYVPDYTGDNIVVESYNTDGNEWHPKVEWDVPAGFPSEWENYFETEIWRQKEPIGMQSGEWELLATEDMNTTSYIDYDLTSPGGEGTFAITGYVNYKVKLAQTTNNPNYDACLNIPNNEEWADSFGFSNEDTTMYGELTGSNQGTTKSFNVNSINITNSIISFSINDNYIKNTTFKLYNIKGQHVRTIKEDDLTSGHHTIKWNGKDKYGKNLSSGLYMMKTERGNSINVNKALFVK